MVKEYWVSVKTIVSLDAMKFGYWYKTAIEIHIHQNDSFLAQICADGFIVRINHGANELMYIRGSKCQRMNIFCLSKSMFLQEWNIVVSLA